MAITLPVVDAPGFFGTRGVGDYVTDEVEPSFRRLVFELDPNGGTTLLGITSMLGSERETNSEFTWWEDKLAKRGGTVEIYSDHLSTAWTTGTATVGTLCWAKVAAALAAHFRVRHQVRLTTTNYPERDLVAEVTSVKINGANSEIGLKMLVADASAVNLGSADYIAIIGNVNPDGSFIPTGVGVQKTKRYNHLQTFRNPIKITRRAMKQRLRTGDALKMARKDCLKYHGLDMELALIFSEMDDGATYGENGEPQTTLEGIIPAIRNNVSENVLNFYSSELTEFHGYSWDQAGETFVDAYLRQLFHYGPNTRTCICGSGFLAGINRVVTVNSTIDIKVGQTDYGIAITRWVSPWGTVYFKTHPLFTDDPTYTYSGLFLVPDYLKMVVHTDSHFKALADEDKNQDMTGYDGAVEEWLSDISIKAEGLEAMMVWHGVGLNNHAYSA